MLDDASSGLDTVTESEVSAAVTGALAGRTRIVVAHRVATAVRCDQVVWLDGGRVRARGTHAELWHDPAYRAVFAADGAEGGTGETDDVVNDATDDDMARGRYAGHRGRDPGLRLSGRRRPAPGGRRPGAGLSAVQTAPALASGRMLATALDHGFLTGRPTVGILWLTGIAALYGVRAAAQRAVFDPLAAIVEPMRDELVRRVVRGALRRAVDEGLPGDRRRRGDPAEQPGGRGARHGRRVLRRAAARGEPAGRAARAGLPRPADGARGGGAAADGRGGLRPGDARPHPAPDRLLLLAEERSAAATGSVVAAARDVAAIGARREAMAEVHRAADASARAATTVAWANALRAR